MSRMRAIPRMVFGAAVILAALLSGAIEDECYSAQQAADVKDAAGGTAGICMLSGKVVNFETGEPVPYFICSIWKRAAGSSNRWKQTGKATFIPQPRRAVRDTFGSIDHGGERTSLTGIARDK